MAAVGCMTDAKCFEEGGHCYLCLRSEGPASLGVDLQRLSLTPLMQAI